MIVKFISLATAIVTLDVYLQSQLYSNDPLFLFASNNLAVNIGLVVLTCAAVAVSFRHEFKNWVSYALCTMMALFFGGLGLLGTFFSSVMYAFPNVILPLDYLFMLEAGVIFAICSMTYRHEKFPYRIKLPQFTAMTNKIALPVPKIPQSPTGYNRT